MMRDSSGSGVATAPELIVVAKGSFGDLEWLRSSLPHEVRLEVRDISAPDATSGAAGLVVTLQRLDATAIASLAPTVRVIGRAGVGLDSIDVEAVRRRGGLALFREPAYGVSEVASHAVALLHAVQRRLGASDAFVRRGWRGPLDLSGIRPLDELTLGVIGCGRIGSAFVERMLPSVADVVVHDPGAVVAPPGAERVADLDTLLRSSDLVSLHLPLTGDTRHLIGRRELELLPPGALLINVSRGGLVDEVALATALRQGRLGGAGLDVFEEEPLPGDSPLLELPNVLMTPHCAASSDRAARRLAAWTIGDAAAWLTRQTIDHGQLVHPEI
jgi:D-3-phosphoglycerate dehydrogenase / 2-oxoglutarate reductase